MLRFVFCTTCYKLSKHESVPVSHECVLCYSDSHVVNAVSEVERQLVKRLLWWLRSGLMVV